MTDLLVNSQFFGFTLTLILFFAAAALKRRFNSPLVNPVIISTAAIILILVVLKVPYDSYNQSARFISYLLTPATVCLAIPMYRQLGLLKKNVKCVLISVAAGTLFSLASVLLMTTIMSLETKHIITLLPKSVTAAIGVALSDENGGIATLTLITIILTGAVGNTFGPQILKLFRVKEPISQGLALGTATHAIGTSKALELGEIQGAMGSLALVIAGILTTILMPIMIRLFL